MGKVSGECGRPVGVGVGVEVKEAARPRVRTAVGVDRCRCGQATVVGEADCERDWSGGCRGCGLD